MDSPWVFCSPAAGLGVKHETLRSVRKRSAEWKESKRRSEQKRIRMSQLRVRLSKGGSGKRGKLDETTNQLRVEEIYVQFGPTVCLLAGFAIVPLLAQVSGRSNSLAPPYGKLLKRWRLLCPPLLIQGSSSPQD